MDPVGGMGCRLVSSFLGKNISFHDNQQRIDVCGEDTWVRVQVLTFFIFKMLPNRAADRCVGYYNEGLTEASVFNASSIG